MCRCACFKTINEDYLSVGKFALKQCTLGSMEGEINQECGEKCFLVMVSCLGRVHGVYVVTADPCCWAMYYYSNTLSLGN